MEQAKYSYVIYIAASPEKLWNALIDPAVTAKYWQHTNDSDWKINSKWEHRRITEDHKVDILGKVIEFSQPKQLILSWAFPEDENNEAKYSTVSLKIEPHRGVSMLTVSHEQLEPGSDMLEGITEGWPKVISSLKTLLETGEPMPVLW